MKEYEEIVKLIFILILVAVVGFVLVYLFKGEAIGQSLRDAWDSLTNYWNATQLPKAGQQPGSNLAGFDDKGNPVYSSAVEGGGFGGGGTGGF